MSPAQIANAIQDTEFFTAIRESGLAYPIILSSHLTMIAVFGGLILATDLRLLGWALTSVPASEIIRRTRPFKYVGFVCMISLGIMLGGAKLADYYSNPFFLIKMSLLATVGVHALVFRPRVYKNPEILDGPAGIPRVAKVAAVLSLMLWIGILSMGRWIAYYEPEDDPHHPKAPVVSKP
jgi:hypothetical protein